MAATENLSRSLDAGRRMPGTESDSNADISKSLDKPADDASAFVYFLEQLNSNGSSSPQKTIDADDKPARKPTNRETLVPSSGRDAESDDDTRDPVAVPPAQSVPHHSAMSATGGPSVGYAAGQPMPMAYVPRDLALATVIALAISSSPWVSAQDLENMVKTQHPALYDPYGVPGLIQTQLMIASNLRNGVKFVATEDPKPPTTAAPRPPVPPPPPHMGPGMMPPGLEARKSSGGPPPPPPRPMMSHMTYTVPPKPMRARPDAMAVSGVHADGTDAASASGMVARAPLKRTGVASWSNFTQEDFANKKKRKRGPSSPPVDSVYSLAPPVRAQES